MDEKNVKEWARNNIREDYDNVKNYFSSIIHSSYDMIIFISRRCYILFYLFSIIENWDINMDIICTDLGLYSRKDKLKKCKNILVADDIAFTGYSMRSVIRKLDKYQSSLCSVEARLFAIDASHYDSLLYVKTRSFKKVKIFHNVQRTHEQCQQLSYNLLKIIMASGIPYTTFVYPEWILADDYSDKIFAEYDYSIERVAHKRRLEDDTRWDTQYICFNNNSIINPLSDFVCIRKYKKDTNILLLPFLFLRNIKADKVEEFYQLISEMFDNKVIEEIIVSILNEERKFRKDSFEYLASMISCLWTKILLAEFDISGEENVVEQKIRASLRGSFSDDFINFLTDIDKYNISSFIDKIKLKENEFNSFFSSECVNKYIYYDELKEAVEKDMKSVGDNDVYDIMTQVFEWMKRRSEENKEKSDEIRNIAVVDLIQLLSITCNFKEKDIYLALIECWDRGVATYRFYFDEIDGIIAVCGAGEMSSLVTSLKYQKIISEFYKKLLLSNIKETEEVRKSILDEAVKSFKEQYSENEITKFYQLYSDNNKSLYKYLI